jgi:nucleoid-associated protein YgaU
MSTGRHRVPRRPVRWERVFEASMVAGISAGIFSGVAPAHAEEAPVAPSTIADAARSAGLPCVTAVAVAEAESDGVPDAVGPVGEVGVMQVAPGQHPDLASYGDTPSVAESMAEAATLYRWAGDSFAPWTTYGGDRYEAALPTATAACSRHGATTTAAQSSTPRHAARVAARSYTVRAGDCLSSIAARLGLDGWHQLYAANRDVIETPDLIYPGQTLTIPGG